MSDEATPAETEAVREMLSCQCGFEWRYLRAHVERENAKLREHLKDTTDILDRWSGELEPIGAPDDPCSVNIARACIEANHALLG